MNPPIQFLEPVRRRFEVDTSTTTPRLRRHDYDASIGLRHPRTAGEAKESRRGSLGDPKGRNDSAVKNSPMTTARKYGRSQTCLLLVSNWLVSNWPVSIWYSPLNSQRAPPPRTRRSKSRSARARHSRHRALEVSAGDLARRNAHDEPRSNTLCFAMSRAGNRNQGASQLCLGHCGSEHSASICRGEAGMGIKQTRYPLALRRIPFAQEFSFWRTGGPWLTGRHRFWCSPQAKAFGR